MAQASIYARSDKASDGEVLIYIRFTHGGERARMSLNLKVRESQWNSNKSRVRSSHEQSEYLNQYLSDVRAAADGVVARCKSNCDSHPGALKKQRAGSDKQ